MHADCWFWTAQVRFLTCVLFFELNPLFETVIYLGFNRLVRIEAGADTLTVREPELNEYQPILEHAFLSF